MRILISGGAGFVGSHIADHAIAAGHDVTIVDNLSTGKRENVNPAAEFIQAPYQGCADEVFSADVVIHAAAYADLRHNWNNADERERIYRENVEGTWCLLEAMPSTTKLLFLSTASVYGAARNAVPVTEADAFPWTCESPYAASKFACEAMIASYAFARGFRWKIGRLVNVVGARTAHGVIGDFVRMHKATGKIHAADNGKQRKSWVNVHDVADAFLRMIDDDVPDGVYSVTSRERISWWDLTRMMGVPAEEITFEDRPGGAIGDPVDLKVHPTKLGQYYHCERPVADGVREALTHLGWGK